MCSYAVNMSPMVLFARLVLLLRLSGRTHLLRTHAVLSLISVCPPYLDSLLDHLALPSDGFLLELATLSVFAPLLWPAWLSVLQESLSAVFPTFVFSRSKRMRVRVLLCEGTCFTQVSRSQRENCDIWAP